MNDLLWLLPLVAGAWFWYDSLRAREAARARGRALCQRAGVQFLDDTVACTRLGVYRTAEGWLVLERCFRFEFSDTGDNRLAGSVTVRGARVASATMDPHREDSGMGSVSEGVPLRGSSCGGGCGTPVVPAKVVMLQPRVRPTESLDTAQDPVEPPGR